MQKRATVQESDCCTTVALEAVQHLTPTLSTNYNLCTRNAYGPKGKSEQPAKAYRIMNCRTKHLSPFLDRFLAIF